LSVEGQEEILVMWIVWHAKGSYETIAPTEEMVLKEAALQGLTGIWKVEKNGELEITPL